MLLLEIVLGVVIAVAVADFLSGLIHWAEDTYGHPDTPIIGPLIIAPNLLHHVKPRDFCKKTYWQSSWDLWLAAAVVIGVASAIDALSWEVIVFAITAANANQIHKWSHQNREEVGPVVWALQRAGVLLTQRSHANHHSGAKNTSYCAITNFVNPVLDRLGFWRILEAVIEAIFGVSPRVDPTAKPIDSRLAKGRAA